MMLNGPGFHVDVDAVDRAGCGISDSVHDQDAFELRALCGESDMYGHTPLRDALMDFCVRWSDGLDVLTDDAGTIGDTLTRAANAYREIDQATIDKLGGDPATNAVQDG